MTATYKLQSDNECMECEISNGCNYCQGYNYDESNTSTNFYRAKYICKMHKARVRANEYYFAKLFNRFGIERINDGRERKRLYFLLSDDYVDYCTHHNTSKESGIMSQEKVIEGLKYAHENFMTPIFVHSGRDFNFKNHAKHENHMILHVLPAKFYKEAAYFKKCLFVFDESSISIPITNMTNCILNVDSHDIGNLYAYIAELLLKTKRINLNILDIDRKFDEETYLAQLTKIKDLLVEIYRESGVIKEISLLTDLCFIKDYNNCKAGDRSFVYAPDAKIYACSAFYGTGKQNALGDTENGLFNLLDAHLYKSRNSALCELCDAFQCINCVFMNKKATNEVNVSPSYQCRKSHIEREVSRLYQIEMEGSASRNNIDELAYKDPMTELYDSKIISIGYYDYAKN